MFTSFLDNTMNLYKLFHLKNYKICLKDNYMYIIDYKSL